MIRALHVFALVAFVAYVSAFCTTDADCPTGVCGHGEVNSCLLVNGAGGGNGEKQCKCVHHKKRADECQTNSDCAHTSCPHGKHHACLQHGSTGEKYCGCA
ncbi:uncharacterized protein LOC127871167 isoform X1 [Dreissena polymorpha]|uniref:Uncharacterized protein n=1 Tax=Dreissena polymorpha TaxID=45954 RepID=A0A9D4LF83_DREPO|nr:uncharacterized protein LOC127871167 isoform X1 [Dreissena polymorpha]KAH3856137.1 hypothetical protein DPMN_098717 [Dreissena polymorpha]